MWEISNINQTAAMLYAFLLGGVLGVIYDMFKLDRIIFRRSTVTVFFEDIIFWLIAAFLTFCLLLITANGQVRLYVLFFVFISFFVYYFTLSRFVLFMAPYIKKLSRKTSKKYNIAIKFTAKSDAIVLNFLKRVKNCFKIGKKCPKNIKNNIKNT